MKVALITGVTGQDGLYLAEFLLEKGYEEYWRVVPPYLILGVSIISTRIVMNQIQNLSCIMAI